MRNHAIGWRRQAGVTAVEFALVSVFIFFPVLIAVTSFGRWIYTLNAASEATRYGARLAVVCDIGDSAIRTRMRFFLPQAGNDSNIVIQYSPQGCTVFTCESVTVSLSNVVVGWLPWFIPTDDLSVYSGLPIPAFTHTLTRESLRSVAPAPDGTSNPFCE